MKMIKAKLGVVNEKLMDKVDNDIPISGGVKKLYFLLIINFSNG